MLKDPAFKRFHRAFIQSLVLAVPLFCVLVFRR